MMHDATDTDATDALRAAFAEWLREEFHARDRLALNRARGTAY
jgi:hypothetical protein